MKRHDCSRWINGKYWAICSCCQGRCHKPGCTSKRDPRKDCCEERHKRLAAQGQTTGIADSSQPMYDHNNPTWDVK